MQASLLSPLLPSPPSRHTGQHGACGANGVRALLARIPPRQAPGSTRLWTCPQLCVRLGVVQRLEACLLILLFLLVPSSLPPPLASPKFLPPHTDTRQRTPTGKGIRLFSGLSPLPLHGRSRGAFTDEVRVAAVARTHFSPSPLCVCVCACLYIERERRAFSSSLRAAPPPPRPSPLALPPATGVWVRVCAVLSSCLTFYPSCPPPPPSWCRCCCCCCTRAKSGNRGKGREEVSAAQRLTHTHTQGWRPRSQAATAWSILRGRTQGVASSRPVTEPHVFSSPTHLFSVVGLVCRALKLRCPTAPYVFHSACSRDDCVQLRLYSSSSSLLSSRSGSPRLCAARPLCLLLPPSLVPCTACASCRAAVGCCGGVRRPRAALVMLEKHRSWRGGGGLCHHFAHFWLPSR